MLKKIWIGHSCTASFPNQEEMNWLAYLIITSIEYIVHQFPFPPSSFITIFICRQQQFTCPLPNSSFFFCFFFILFFFLMIPLPLLFCYYTSKNCQCI
jgi:hypothetical protein